MAFEQYRILPSHLVGSGAKNLETQNEKEPVDLDYNLVVINSSCNINDGKQIKEYIRKKFNITKKYIMDARWYNSKRCTC